MEYLILNGVGRGLKIQESSSLLRGTDSLSVETQPTQESAGTTLYHKGSEFKLTESPPRGDI